MIKAYINYPNAHVTIHGNSVCSNIRMQGKEAQRVIRIDTSTVSSELKRFEERGYRFGAQSELNDMWLHIDFGDADFEVALAAYIKRLLGKHYKPIAGAKIARHCRET